MFSKEFVGPKFKIPKNIYTLKRLILQNGIDPPCLNICDQCKESTQVREYNLKFD
jgi:hypothetical protein